MSRVVGEGDEVEVGGRGMVGGFGGSIEGGFTFSSWARACVRACVRACGRAGGKEEEEEEEGAGAGDETRRRASLARVGRGR